MPASNISFGWNVSADGTDTGMNAGAGVSYSLVCRCGVIIPDVVDASEE